MSFQLSRSEKKIAKNAKFKVLSVLFYLIPANHLACNVANRRNYKSSAATHLRITESYQSI